MSNETRKLNTPWWYWLVVAFALLYSGAGLTQLQYLSEYSDPLWSEAGYAIGQVFGAAGAAGLLLRRAWARWPYLISFSGFAVQRAWLVFFSGQLAELPSYVPVTLFMVIVVPLILIGFTTAGLRRGWVR